MSQLTAADIKVGRVYSPRRLKPVGFFNQLINDREVLWVCPLGSQVQYDSPTVRVGQKQPKVSMESFLRWAKEDVTAKMPKNGEWRSA